MAAKYEEIAKSIIQVVGGKENIISATHCATRLRLILKDKDIVDDSEMKKVNMVKGTMYTAGQYQIILGTGTVNKVYKEVIQLGVNEESGQAQNQVKESKKDEGSKAKKILRVFGDIFVPLIPILAAIGLCLGLQGVITNDIFLGLFGMSSADYPASFVTILNALCNTVFDFLPAFICWSAFRNFGGTPVLGFVVGLMLVNPALPNAYAVAKGAVDAIELFGFIPIIGYQGSVLPAIIAGFIGAKLEIKLRDIMPDSLDFMFTPFLVIVLTVLASLLAIGPVFHAIENGILWGVEKILYLPFGIGAFIVAFAHPFLVITGVHHIFNALEIGITAAGSLNAFRTLVILGTTVKACAVLAITVKMHNKRMKSAGYGAMTSQFLGIGEPAIFGFLIRYSFKPLIVCTLIGALASAVAMMMGVDAQGMGINGVLGTLLYIYDPSVLIKFIAINVISGVLSFIAVYMFAVPEEFLTDEE